MEGEINSQEKNRLARRKRITINLELQKKPNGYPVNLRITEDGKHKRFKSTVELLPLRNFYRAEEYHQDYLEKNPGGYCHLSPAIFKIAEEG